MRYKQRRYQCDHDRNRYVREKNRKVGFRAYNHRCENYDRCSRSRDYRKSYFFDSTDSRLDRIVRILGAVAKDTFGDDHGVIDEHTYSEHEAHHRQDIQAKTREVKCAQGNHQRKRHRRGYDEGGRYLAQKQVQNNYGEQTAKRAGTLPENYDLARGVIATRRLIKGYSDTHARGLSKYDRVLAGIALVAARDDAAERRHGRLRRTAAGLDPVQLARARGKGVRRTPDHSTSDAS